MVKSRNDQQQSVNSINQNKIDPWQAKSHSGNDPTEDVQQKKETSNNAVATSRNNHQSSKSFSEDKIDHWEEKLDSGNYTMEEAWQQEESVNIALTINRCNLDSVDPLEQGEIDQWLVKLDSGDYTMEEAWEVVDPVTKTVRQIGEFTCKRGIHEAASFLKSTGSNGPKRSSAGNNSLPLWNQKMCDMF